MRTERHIRDCKQSNIGYPLRRQKRLEQGRSRRTKLGTYIHSSRLLRKNLKACKQHNRRYYRNLRKKRKQELRQQRGSMWKRFRAWFEKNLFTIEELGWIVSIVLSAGILFGLYLLGTILW